VRRNYVEPVSVMIAAVAGAAFVQAVPGDGAVSTGVRVAGALPLLFVLPGRAICLALSRPHGRGDQLRDGEGRLELWTWTGAISIALAVGGAFLLNVLPVGLTRTSWTALLTVGTVVGASVALAREAARAPSAVSPPHAPPEHDAEFGRRSAGRELRAGGLLMLASALVVASLAIGLAWWSEKAETYPGFTQLWLAKQVGTGLADEPAVAQAELGVQNFEERSGSYRLTLNDSVDRAAQEWTFQLQPNERWVAPVTVAPGHRVEATLYYDNDPRAYRRVTLQAQ
jgi:hypothetical protein